MLHKINSKVLIDEFLHQYGKARAQLPYLLPKPLGYFLFITGECNLDCVYCWQRHQEELPEENGWINSTPRALSTEEWIKVVEKLPRRSFIGISGGEATISKSLLPVVKAASRRHPISINTNLLSIKENELEALTHNNVRNVSVSIDGFADVHDKSRNRKGLFDKIVENIRIINEIKGNRKYPKITIKTVLLNENLESMPEFRHFCGNSLQANEINISFEKINEHRQFSLFHNSSLQKVLSISKPALYPYEAPDRVSLILQDMLHKNISETCKLVIYPRMKNSRQIENFLAGKGENVYKPCYLPFSMMSVLPDGEVIPCLSASMGNVKDFEYDIEATLKNGDYANFCNSLLNWQQLPPACNVCCFSTVSS